MALFYILQTIGISKATAVRVLFSRRTRRSPRTGFTRLSVMRIPDDAVFSCYRYSLIEFCIMVRPRLDEHFQKETPVIQKALERLSLISGEQYTAFRRMRSTTNSSCQSPEGPGLQSLPDTKREHIAWLAQKKKRKIIEEADPEYPSSTSHDVNREMKNCAVSKLERFDRLFVFDWLMLGVALPT